MISLISAASSFCRRANPSKFLPQGLMLSERLGVRPCQSPPSRLEGFGLSGQRRAVGFFVPLASLHFRWQSYTFTCTSYHMAGKISTEQHMAKGLTTAKGALARATLDECEDDARARQLRAANFNRIASLRSASARHGTAALKVRGWPQDMSNNSWSWKPPPSSTLVAKKDNSPEGSTPHLNG